jgi:UDP-N-acetylmuramoyl-tripeptide--D-alanyl-D-alanine ligase
MSGPTKPDFSVAEVLAAAGGALIGGRREVRIQGVSTDSRSIAPGNLFVALPGATFDGHDYLDQAASLGAGGLLVQRWDGRDRGALPTLLVPDTVRALGDLAAAWRRRFALPVAALSGSAGKTTTKEMTALNLAGDRLVLKTAGNQNNLIGLPLTLFRLHARHEAAVLELGTNRPGEIARLASIACPDAALITNVGPAHLEGLGSLEGVAREKGDLFAHMKERGVAVVNGDDPRVRALNTSRAGQVVTFGLEGKPDVTARHLRDDDVGGIRFDLAVSGRSGRSAWPCPGDTRCTTPWPPRPGTCRRCRHGRPGPGAGTVPPRCRSDGDHHPEQRGLRDQRHVQRQPRLRGRGPDGPCGHEGFGQGPGGPG